MRLKGIGRPVHVFQLVAGGPACGLPPAPARPSAAARAAGRLRPVGARATSSASKSGEGDFGLVYRAYQPSIGREVAIKVIRPELVNRAGVRPSASRPRHGSWRSSSTRTSCPLYDYWRDPEGAYLVMRWLRGGSLRQALEKRSVEPRAGGRACLAQVAGALSYAHRQGIDPSVTSSRRTSSSTRRATHTSRTSGSPLASSTRRTPAAFGHVVARVPVPRRSSTASRTRLAPTSTASASSAFELLTGRRTADGRRRSRRWPSCRRRAAGRRARCGDRQGDGGRPGGSLRRRSPPSLARLRARARDEAVAAPRAWPSRRPRTRTRACAPFEEADADDFYGRDAARRRSWLAALRRAQAGRGRRAVGHRQVLGGARQG